MAGSKKTFCWLVTSCTIFEENQNPQLICINGFLSIWVIECSFWSWNSMVANGGFKWLITKMTWIEMKVVVPLQEKISWQLFRCCLDNQCTKHYLAYPSKCKSWTQNPEKRKSNKFKSDLQCTHVWSTPSAQFMFYSKQYPLLLRISAAILNKESSCPAAQRQKKQINKKANKPITKQSVRKKSGKKVWPCYILHHMKNCQIFF